MKKLISFKKVFLLMSVAGMIGVSEKTLAGAFQLWEQDGGSVGNYHAGRAAVAEDASTAYYNPAGLVRIHNQELLFAADPILTSFLLNGDIKLNTMGETPLPFTAQGGNFNLVPSFNYAAPMTDNAVFGFSVVSPFGLKTDYGQETSLRYAAIITSLRVIDVSPSFGFAINDVVSVGAGLDIERADGEFDLGATAFDPSEDTEGDNKGDSKTAYGYHAGVLFQLTPATRIGLSYHSKMRLHFEGTSEFSGPLANDATGGVQESDDLRFNMTLPATTTLSAFHAFNSTWDVMGSVIYTEWNVFKDMLLENVAGIDDDGSTNELVIDVPQNFHNTWNFSVGANYHINPQMFLRTGVGYDQTPTNDQDRNAQLPDADRIALAFGWHYQATRALGFDVSWTHFFTMHTDIDKVVQEVGMEETTLNSSVEGNADVYGLQMKWDIL